MLSQASLGHERPGLHGLTAQLHHLQAGLEVEDSGDGQRGVFPQREASNSLAPLHLMFFAIWIVKKSMLENKVKTNVYHIL